MVVSYNLELAAPIINKAEYSRVLQGINRSAYFTAEIFQSFILSSRKNILTT